MGLRVVYIFPPQPLPITPHPNYSLLHLPSYTTSMKDSFPTTTYYPPFSLPFPIPYLPFPTHHSHSQPFHTQVLTKPPTGRDHQWSDHPVGNPVTCPSYPSLSLYLTFPFTSSSKRLLVVDG